VTEYRVGTGFDTHALEEGVPLVLGGVRIDFPRGLAGHSDGDVLAHALTDAVLGAAGLEDIGALFPPGDPALAGADSLELLAKAWERVRIHGWTLANADVDPDLVAVRATTTDGLGFTGRGEGLAAQAVALLVR
jgi:2-C-methyl-D-erythritol 2,4-cyclodiphosphate synthase